MNFWNLKNVKLLVCLVTDLILLCPQIEFLNAINRIFLDDTGEILKLNPSYKAPPDYRPLLKEDRLPLPVRLVLH